MKVQVTAPTPIRVFELTHRQIKRGDGVVELSITDGCPFTFELVNSQGVSVYKSTKRFPTAAAATRCANRTLKTVVIA